MTTSLWPDIKFEPIKTPITILQEQASFLGQLTQNIVKAEVKPASLNQEFKRGFEYSFRIVAPALNNYTYKLFDITHDIELYPILLYSDMDIFKDLRKEKSIRELLSPSEMQSKDSIISIPNEEIFIKALQIIFSSDKVNKIIQAIISQSVDLQKKIPREIFSPYYKDILYYLWNNGEPQEIAVGDIHALIGPGTYGNHKKLSLPPWGLLEDGEQPKHRRLSERGMSFIRGELQIPQVIRKTENSEWMADTDAPLISIDNI